jgi:tetratricopeptide (TPR) repeat protein
MPGHIARHFRYCQVNSVIRARAACDDVAVMHNHHSAQDDPGLTRLLHKAHTAHVDGSLAQAEKLYKAVLDRDPDNFDALHCLGALNQQRGRLPQALRFLAAALKCNPRSADVLSSHGLVLHLLGRVVEARASYETALAVAPDDADVRNRLGAALLHCGLPWEALATLDRVLAQDPDHSEALGNRGNALLKLNRPEEAIACYDAARRIAGDSARLLTNRAHALRRLDRLEHALADLRKAIALDAEHAEAHFELGMAQLTLGDFDRGWAAYERRWDTGAFAVHRRDFTSPLWTGDQSVRGRTILLHAEQGLGDTIQFARYAAHVARLGATVMLEVQPELTTLMTGLEGPARIIAHGKKLPPFDLHCPLMSLPLACKTITTSLADLPYIKVPEQRIAAWVKRIPARRPAVGICWAGRPSHHNDLNRSIALARLAPLFDMPDIQFISLQRDASPNERALLHSHGNVFDVTSDFADFVDTAALISRLDLVVTVDTAVAHLTGALAKPVAVLLPFAADFRWLRARTDSPWYPTATLFRQPRFGDWESVIGQLRIRLLRLRRASHR